MKRINKIFAAASLAVVSALTVAPTAANAADANSANTGSVKCSDNALFIAPPTGGTATFMPTDIPQGAGTSQIGFKIKAETDAHVENISYNTSYFLQNLSYSEAVKTGVDANAIVVVLATLPSCSATKSGNPFHKLPSVNLLVNV